MRAFRPIVSLAIASLAALHARAEGEVSVRVAVSPGVACADADAFYAAVAARTPRARRAAPGEVGKTLQLEGGPVGARWRGSVIVDGRAPRSVEAATCEDAVAALAFVAALAIDPAARATPIAPSASSSSSSSASASASSPAPSPSASRSSAPAPSSAASAPPVVAPPVRASPASASAPPGFGHVDAPPRSPAPGPRPRLAVEAAAGARSVGALGVAFAPVLGLALGFGEGTWSPLVRLYAQRGATRTAVSDVGSAEFRWTFAQAELCPLRLGDDAVALRPCAGFFVGALGAEGRAVVASASATRAWAGALAAIDARVRLLGPLAVGVRLGVEIPFARDRFFLGPDEFELFRSPPLVPFGELGLRADIL